jgi:hypothetical protein
VSGLRVAATPSAPFGSGQLWAKPQPAGALAALLINHGSKAMSNYSVSLTELNLTKSSYAVKDIWTGASLGTATQRLTLAAPSYDSAFVLLTPA